VLVRVRAVDVRQGPPVPVIYNILTDTATGTRRLTLSHTHTHTHTLTGCMCVCGSVYGCAQRKPLNGTTWHLALDTLVQTLVALYWFWIHKGKGSGFRIRARVRGRVGFGSWQRFESRGSASSDTSMLT